MLEKKRLFHEYCIKNNFFIKEDVCFGEHHFYKIASDNNISPKLHRFNFSTNSLITDRINSTLCKYLETNVLKKEIEFKIKEKIAKLHSLKIFHGDLHSENILIDENEEVYIIDFGYSIHFDDINDEYIEFYSGLWEDIEKNKLKTLDEILQHEMNIWKN